MVRMARTKREECSVEWGKGRADRLGTLLQCLSRSPMQTLCQHAHDHSLKGECGFHRRVVRRPGNVARDYFT
jgi:hypothetical protein